jgi:hypothetical protein
MQSRKRTTSSIQSECHFWGVACEAHSLPKLSEEGLVGRVTGDIAVGEAIPM